jgi:hypothetical protein
MPSWTPKRVGWQLIKVQPEIATAIDVAIGRKVDVVAVFEVSSVRKTMKVVINKTINQGLSSTNKLNDVPNH